MTDVRGKKSLVGQVRLLNRFLEVLYVFDGLVVCFDRMIFQWCFTLLEPA